MVREMLDTLGIGQEVTSIRWSPSKVFEFPQASIDSNPKQGSISYLDYWFEVPISNIGLNKISYLV
jgi:hypothetical protein